MHHDFSRSSMLLQTLNSLRDACLLEWENERTFNDLVKGVQSCLMSESLNDMSDESISSMHWVLSSLHPISNRMTNGRSRMERLYRRTSQTVNQLTIKESMTRNELSNTVLLNKMLICQSPESCSNLARDRNEYYPIDVRTRFFLLPVLMELWRQDRGAENVDPILQQVMESETQKGPLEPVDLRKMQQNLYRKIKRREITGKDLTARIVDICYLFHLRLIAVMKRDEALSELQASGIDGRWLQRIASKVKTLPDAVPATLTDYLCKTVVFLALQAEARMGTLSEASSFQERLGWASYAVFGSSQGKVRTHAQFPLSMRQILDKLFPRAEMEAMVGLADVEADLMRCAMLKLVALPRLRSDNYPFSIEFKILSHLHMAIQHQISTFSCEEKQLTAMYDRLISLMKPVIDHFQWYRHDHLDVRQFLLELLKTHRHLRIYEDAVFVRLSNALGQLADRLGRQK